MYYYDEKEAKRAVGWIETFCTHTVGALKGQPLRLDDFQKEIVMEGLGWRIEENGNAKYSTIYVEIPRGNAKTTLAISLGMYLAFGAGIDSAKAFCVASSKDQVLESLFEPAKLMVEQNEELYAELSTYHNSVRDYSSDSTFKILSADWKVGHSLIPSTVIMDELHLQPNRKLWDGFKSGMAKRTDCTPQMWIFTTAGEVDTFAHLIHKKALDVKAGRTKSETFLPFIFGADEGDDPFDQETWEKANPGWHFLNQREFREFAEDAEKYPSSLNTFKRYNLNIWTSSSESWIPAHEWTSGAGEVNLEQLLGENCYGALYAASVRDLMSFCLWFPDSECFVWWFWCPSAQAKLREGSTPGFSDWLESGYIIEEPGNTLGDEHFLEKIDEISQLVNIREIAYFRSEATSKVIALQEMGMNMVPYSIRSYADMNVPTKEVEKKLLEGRLNHGGNPVAAYQVDCTQIEYQDDLIRPSSKHSRDNISGVFAMIMALAAAMNADQDEEDQEVEIDDLFDVF